METETEILSNQEPEYDAIIILGGNIRKTGQKSGLNGYVSTSYKEGPEKSIGARWRPGAAAKMYNEGRVKYFIVSTGKTHPDPEAPSEAAVLKAELMHYGVPEDRIIVEDRSENTYQNAQETLRIAREMGLKNIGVLTSTWHLPRSMMMFRDVWKKEYQGTEIALHPVSTEGIWVKKHPRVKKFIKEVYSSESMRKVRIPREIQGIKDFKAGTYRPKPIEYKPEEK